MIRLTKNRARAGFTLIELMAVILIIGILAVALLPNIFSSVEGAKLTACKQNMRKVYEGLLLYQTRFGHAPRESGVKFFGELIASGVWESSEKNAMQLVCPAVDTGFLVQVMDDLPPEEWFTDLDRVDGGWSTYAGRNMRRSPLRKFPGSGSEPIMACANHDPFDDVPMMNHEGATNVLFADGSVKTFELSVLKRESEDFGPDEEVLVVGPDSQLEALRKLSLD
jgi:prepilin-type N-terminal cleavage/methylation domain-containing protein/prepilin-type processing-associated H-X9-DG protein